MFTIAWTGSLLTQGSQEEGNATPQGDTQGHTSVDQKVEGEGDCCKSLYCGFRGKQYVRQGNQASDWLV